MPAQPDARMKTVVEHAEFLREMVRLQLWFLWVWLRRHPEESFATAIRTRVDIFRKTDLNVGPSKNTKLAGDFALPAWLELESRAEALCRETGSADEFESRAWDEIFGRTVEARAPRDFAEGDALDDFQCGSLRYNTPKPGALRVGFHIGNRIAPRSIFADPDYLPRCLRLLMDETERRFGVRELGTSSWLNSYPRWLALFPRSWQDSLTLHPEEVGWSQGHWGQFVSARGTFNFKHARLLRETGELPFKVRIGWCRFDELREHLRTHLKSR